MGRVRRVWRGKGGGQSVVTLKEIVGEWRTRPADGTLMLVEVAGPQDTISGCGVWEERRECYIVL